jgi:hypothetical protein
MACNVTPSVSRIHFWSYERWLDNSNLRAGVVVADVSYRLVFAHDLNDVTTGPRGGYY